MVPTTLNNNNKVKFILLPAERSIVLPVGYMGQPTGLLHTYLWRRLCGRSGEEVRPHLKICLFPVERVRMKKVTQAAGKSLLFF